MAKLEKKTLVEAARAAVLATHSAAGLALASSREAARLLRAAEALSRSAVAVLSMPPRASSPKPKSGGLRGHTSDEASGPGEPSCKVIPPAGLLSSPGPGCNTGETPLGSSTRGATAPSGRRRRRRPRQQKQQEVKAQMDGKAGQRLDVVAPPRSVGSGTRERVLVRRETLPPVPSPAPGIASPCVPRFSSGIEPRFVRPGLVYKLAELTARTELNHRSVKVLRRCEETGRWVVELLDDPAAVPFRVKDHNLAGLEQQGSQPATSTDVDVDMGFEDQV